MLFSIVRLILVRFVKEAANIEEFQRWFATVFLRDSSMFALYPEDYDIYSLLLLMKEHMTSADSLPPRVVCSVEELFSIFKIPRPTSAQPGE